MSVVGSLLDQRRLVSILLRRRLKRRYEGTTLGMAWALAVPLLTIAVLSLVFGEILQVRWQLGPVQAYPVILFSGLVVHFFVAECIASGPELARDYAHLLKQTRFPAETLAWIVVMDSLTVHLLAFAALLCALAFYDGLSWWVLLALPVTLLPLMLLGLGLVWLLAGLGAFWRDIKQLSGLATSAMLLLSPVLYPLERVPEELRLLLLLNPITLIVDNLRTLLFNQTLPGTLALAVPVLASAVFAYVANALFRRVQGELQDTL